MKKMFTALLVLLCVTLVGVKAYSDNGKQTEWENTRTVTTVIVDKGDTLDDFGYQYKPDWMDVREYRQKVMALNNMSSAMLYSGQSLKLYVCCEQYTIDGLCLDDGYTIITADGNEWSCSTDIIGCAQITFSDNGTPDKIDDDIIIDIKKY